MKRRLVVVVLLVLVGVGFWWWRRARADDDRLVLSGSIEARTVEVGSLVGGRVAKVEIDEGAEVKAGQTLLTLETDLIDAQIARQRALIAEAEARLALAEAGPRSEARSRARVEWEAARTDLGRIESLYRDGLVGRAEYDRVLVRETVARKTHEEAASGSRGEEIAAARAAVERERAQLGYLERQSAELEVRAPVAGRIEAFDLRPGDLVAPNQPVATLLEPGELWVRVYVPEPLLGRVRVGAPVAVRVDTWPERRFAGRVAEVRHQAEYLPRNVQTLDQRSDQVFAVRVELEAADELRPGMAAFVELEPGAAADEGSE